MVNYLKHSRRRNLQHQAGSTTTIILVIAVVIMVGYLKFGRPIVLESGGPHYDSAITGVLAIICVFVIVAFLYRMLRNPRHRYHLEENVREKADRLRHIATKAHKNLNRLEERLGNIQHGVLPPASVNSFREARRISTALARRYQDVQEIIHAKGKDSLNAAYLKLKAPLKIAENSHAHLIDTDPIAPIEVEKIIRTLNEHFVAVDQAITKLERDDKSRDEKKPKKDTTANESPETIV